MRVAWFLFAGLGFTWVSCSSSTPDDLFASGTTGGSQGATGSGGSGDSGGSGGGAPVGAGGSGKGGQASGAGGSGGSGTAGAGMTGGTAGSGGSPAGAGGTTGGDRGGSGGSGGTAGIAGSGNAGSVPDGGGGSGMAGSAGAPPDSGGPLHPIRCGNITCSAPGQFCCIPTNNIARCVVTGGLCPLNADRLACDDRTDCPGLGQVCCAENPTGPGVADCRLPVNCDAVNAGQQLCDPLQMGSCFMPGLTMCMLDQQAIITGYPYCQ